MWKPDKFKILAFKSRQGHNQKGIMEVAIGTWFMWDSVTSNQSILHNKPHHRVIGRISRLRAYRSWHIVSVQYLDIFIKSVIS